MPISIRAIPAHPKRRSGIHFPRGLLVRSRDADGSTEGAVADRAPSHPFGVGLCWPQPRLLAGDLRESAVLGCAQWCQVATGAPWQVIEFAGYLEPTRALIMPGSKVRLPPFPPNITAVRGARAPRHPRSATPERDIGCCSVALGLGGGGVGRERKYRVLERGALALKPRRTSSKRSSSSRRLTGDGPRRRRSPKNADLVRNRGKDPDRLDYEQ